MSQIAKGTAQSEDIGVFDMPPGSNAAPGGLVFTEQGMEHPILTVPTDPRGGFDNNPEFYVHSSIQNGGIINGNTSDVTVPYWNDGANP